MARRNAREDLRGEGRRCVRLCGGRPVASLSPDFKTSDTIFYSERPTGCPLGETRVCVYSQMPWSAKFSLLAFGAFGAETMNRSSSRPCLSTGHALQTMMKPWIRPSPQMRLLRESENLSGRESPQSNVRLDSTKEYAKENGSENNAGGGEVTSRCKVALATIDRSNRQKKILE